MSNNYYYPESINGSPQKYQRVDGGDVGGGGGGKMLGFSSDFVTPKRPTTRFQNRSQTGRNGLQNHQTPPRLLARIQRNGLYPTLSRVYVSGANTGYPEARKRTVCSRSNYTDEEQFQNQRPEHSRYYYNQNYFQHQQFASCPPNPMYMPPSRIGKPQRTSLSNQQGSPSPFSSSDWPLLSTPPPPHHPPTPNGIMSSAPNSCARVNGIARENVACYNSQSSERVYQQEGRNNHPENSPQGQAGQHQQSQQVPMSTYREVMQEYKPRAQIKPCNMVSQAHITPSWYPEREMSLSPRSVCRSDCSIESEDKVSFSEPDQIPRNHSITTIPLRSEFFAHRFAQNNCMQEVPVVSPRPHFTPNWEGGALPVQLLNQEFSQMKLCEAARQGLHHFKEDCHNGFQTQRVFLVNQNYNSQWGTVVTSVPNGMNTYVQHVPEVPQAPVYQKLSDTPVFEVNEEALVDPRPIQNLVHPGEREFRIFDDMKYDSDNFRSVYNVNEMDIFNPREICSRRLFPKSVVSWPLELMGDDLRATRKTVLKLGTQPNSATQTLESILDLSFSEMPGGTPSDDLNKENREASADFGLAGLAKIVSGSTIDRNPMGFITFMGYNLHKLVKDLDKINPITPTFAGPLAERNQTADYSTIEVMKSFEEYNLPYKGAIDDWQDGCRWRHTLRMKRRMLPNLAFDTLMYIFYTLHGDALQILTAGEVYRRGWRFHKIFKIWVIPYESDDGNSVNMDVPWESGVYKYFNYATWRFVIGEFRINESILEGKPPNFDEALWN